MCKFIKYTLFTLFAALSMVSCEIDDFPAPDSTLYGTVYSIRNYNEENESIEPFQAYIGSTSAYVRIYERNTAYPSTTSESMTIMENGSFYQSKMPATSYEVDAYECPFVEIDPGQLVTLPQGGSVEHNIYGIPFLFIDLTLEGNEMVFTITKPKQIASTNNIVYIKVMYSTLPRVNLGVCQIEAETLYNVNNTGGTQDEILGQEFRVNMKDAFPSITNGSYYFRATAQIYDSDPDEENYSEVVYGEYNDGL